METRRENTWMMTMYTVANGPDGPIQASSPIHQLVGTSVIGPTLNIRGNEEVSELSKLSELSSLTESSEGEEDTKLGKGKGALAHHITKETTILLSKTQVGENTPVIMSWMPRENPCDQYKRLGRLCLLRIKGRQALLTCAMCFGLKPHATPVRSHRLV